MPIYEYTCVRCDHAFEKLVGVGAGNSHSVRCPVCRTEKIKRRMSSFGFKSSSTIRLTSCGSCSSGSCGHCRH